MKSFKFLCVHITDNLKWAIHTNSVVKEAQQHLFNLRRLKEFCLASKTRTHFYRCRIEGILSGAGQGKQNNINADTGNKLRIRQI